jgi:hypothetical protein
VKRQLRRPLHLPTGTVPVVSRAELGESPILPVAAVVTAASLYATLPGSFIAGPSSGVFAVARLVVPILTLVLLAPLALSVPTPRALAALGTHAPHALRLSRRLASLAVIALISLANAAAIVLLVHSIVVGDKAHARLLLRAAIHMWCTNVLVFALWFWQLDGGGPLVRRLEPRHRHDFVFPQHLTPELSPAGWQPAFVDYLYVSFTNATAFSPTDTMPYSRWAKLLMILESVASLLLAIMVAARAVNILQ